MLFCAKVFNNEGFELGRIVLKILMSAAVLTLLTPSALAGAWAPGQGQGEVIYGLSGQTAADSFDASGDAEIKTQYQKVTADFYWEYGLSDTLTSVVNAGVEMVTIDSPGRDLQSNTGLSAAQFFLRKQVYKSDNSVVSLQGGVIFGQSGESIPGATLGLGGTDTEMGILAGRSGSLWGKNVFAQIHGAQRFRSEGFADETRIDVTAGLEPNARWQVFMHGFYARGDESKQGLPAYKRLKLQPSVTYRHVYNGRIQIGISQTVSGKNSLNDTGAFIALWKRY